MFQWVRLYSSNAGGLGSISGQGTRFHMLQLRVCMLQLKIPLAATKTVQPNKYIHFFFLKTNQPTLNMYPQFSLMNPVLVSYFARVVLSFPIPEIKIPDSPSLLSQFLNSHQYLVVWCFVAGLRNVKLRGPDRKKGRSRD